MAAPPTLLTHAAARRAAHRHLRASDPTLAAAMRRLGPRDWSPRRDTTAFGHLVRSITGQQLSGKAAATIHGRVVAACGGRLRHPDDLAAVSDATLRAAGLSDAKRRAIRDLAAHVADDRLPLTRLRWLDDEAIIEALVRVRGVGVWTAQMFLMFRLGRPDVLPTLDLGVRRGAMRVYGLRTMPDDATLTRLAEPWRPWRTVACWYLWGAADA